MIHSGFIMREIARSSKQAVVFCLCVALSLTSLTAFSGFSKSVYRTLSADARKLHAADIIVHSHEKLSDELDRAISAEIREGAAVRTRYYEFYSVVRTADDRASVLSNVKIVEKEYPFYGEVVLNSGRPFQEMLKAGQAVVEQPLLDRLGIGIGAPLKVGYTTLIVADVVVSEPDRPVSVFSFGPRVFVSSRDLDAVGLVETRSRINHQTLLKVPDERRTDAVFTRLRQAAQNDGVRVDTFRTARTRVKRFLDNFIFFLNLIGIFILIISGVGIQNTLTAFFNEKQQTIAVMKAVGASSRQVIRHFVPVVFLLGVLGTSIGISAGIGVQFGLARLLAAFFPSGITPSVSWSGIAESLALGFAVMALFTFLPLHRLKELRPVMIFRKETAFPHKRRAVYAFAAGFMLFFFGLVMRHMQNLRFGIYFAAAVIGLILISALSARLLLWILKRIPIRQMVVRQAVKGLFRQGNATQAVIVTLTASLSVIFAIYLIEQNLDATYVTSYPADAPNLYVLDIQPSQREAFAALVAQPMTFHPVVRAQVTAINDKPIDRRAESVKRNDNLGRTFNLTYRQNLLDDEQIIRGRRLFRSDWNEPQVSVLDTVLEMHEMKIGDTIGFNIQGVPLTARISSIRTRITDSLNPFFYFVFEEKTLQPAPQTIFTALKVPKDRIGPLQSRMVKAFPNISVIDLSATIQVFARILEKLSTIVRGFSILSMAAGILILISAVFATRSERITESVYYKILGARRSFVGKVFALEILVLSLLSAMLALFMSQTIAFLVCRYSLDIAYHPFLFSCGLITGAALLVIITVGLIPTRSILAKKPIAYLREQPDE
ncbi:MAG: FtsX-like permease family protein [Desulfobacteraceae bacterium]|nr:MAG: FtsX-like permease family protein [Desulfobacteraceae bacterium]